MHIEEIPGAAIAFLGAVGAFLFILIIFFMYLNKLLCFSSCGGFPCIDAPPKREPKAGKLGSAYAYQDDETSSDSDDEVLKRYQSTLTTTQSIRRTDTTNSFRSSKSTKSSKSRKSVTEKTYLSPKDKVALVNEADIGSSMEEVSQTPRDSSDEESVPQTPKGNSEGGKRSSRAGSGAVSPEASTVSMSPKGSQAQLTFDNQAYQGEIISPSASGSEQVSLVGGMSADEHLFDVSDLQKEPPLISKCGSLEMTFSYDPKRGRMAVTIHQAQEIPSKERGGASNTQVRLLLLPSKKHRFKTKAKPGENPMFQETFLFTKIPQGKVKVDNTPISKLFAELCLN
ncbi:synaptotagmin-14-like isoform X2 [Argopecten irradians]|uniref:synaptotagmin-14-like isoform X2 n=1 Tax=Argopecten irradians TaxID=31199 RepID=UPI003713241B